MQGKRAQKLLKILFVLISITMVLSSLAPALFLMQ